MNVATEPRKESVSCPMDFILRMLMGPWTTYIVYNLRTFGPQRFGELRLGHRLVGVVQPGVEQLAHAGFDAVGQLARHDHHGFAGFGHGCARLWLGP